MRIFTKSRYVFFPPKGIEVKEVHTPLKGFADVPDWVADDVMFRRAVEVGDIEVINSREKQLKAENEAADVKFPKVEAKAAPKVLDAESFEAAAPKGKAVKATAVKKTKIV